MSLASELIARMPEDIRKKTEAQAAAQGQSLEWFVEQHLKTEITDNNLEGVSGGARVRLEADFD